MSMMTNCIQRLVATATIAKFFIRTIEMSCYLLHKSIERRIGPANILTAGGSCMELVRRWRTPCWSMAYRIRSCRFVKQKDDVPKSEWHCCGWRTTPFNPRAHYYPVTVNRQVCVCVRSHSSTDSIIIIILDEMRAYASNSSVAHHIHKHIGQQTSTSTWDIIVFCVLVCLVWYLQLFLLIISGRHHRQ